jgi:putative ABC transport system substrate-binding protein
MICCLSTRTSASSAAEIAHPTQDRPILSRLPTGSDLRQGQRDANELEGAISKIGTDNFQAIVVTHDGLFYVQRKRLADLALERRLPTIGFAKGQWDAGLLATYGPNVPALYRRAGAFIDKIFKGAKPADLPIEQPTKFEFLINLKTAKAIGVTVPPTILTRADDMIE